LDGVPPVLVTQKRKNALYDRNSWLKVWSKLEIKNQNVMLFPFMFNYLSFKTNSAEVHEDEWAISGQTGLPLQTKFSEKPSIR
jgi:hypothetical protein